MPLEIAQVLGHTSTGWVPGRHPDDLPATLGIHLPKDLRRRTSPSTLFQMFLLYHHHVATLDRNAFGCIGTEGQHFLRLFIASELSLLEEGVRRLKAAAEDAAGFDKFMKTLARDVF